MRYMKFYPAFDGKKDGVLLNIGFDDRDECDKWCREHNQLQVKHLDDLGATPNKGRMMTIVVIHWAFMFVEMGTLLLCGTFLWYWAHGNYASAFCALGARIMFFGFPTTELPKL